MTKFWLDEPRMMGWRGISLIVPACASALGFFAFAVLGFGFTELAVLPQWFRTGLVLVGAFSLAFGGEIGTLSNTVEIFRKNGQANAWDWTALIVSACSTLASFLLAFSALFGARAMWATWLQLYGPIGLGLLAALDSYGGFVEFGLYLNSFDKRYQEWQEAKRKFENEQPVDGGQLRELQSQVVNLQKTVVKLSMPIVRDVGTFRSDVIANLNGQRKVIIEKAKSKKELAIMACEVAGRRIDDSLSDTTLAKWGDEVLKNE